MRTIFMTFIALICFYSLKAQDTTSWPKVTFDWYVEGENFFKGKIDNKYPITLFINFDEHEVISEDTQGMYPRFQNSKPVSTGWYYYDNQKKKIPLIGLMKNKDSLVLFAPDTLMNYKDLSLSFTVNGSPDTFKLWGNDGSVAISETFIFTNTKASWTYKGKTKPVTGIKINERKVNPFVGFIIEKKDGSVQKVNITKQGYDISFFQTASYLNYDGCQCIEPTFTPLADGTINAYFDMYVEESCKFSHTIQAFFNINKNGNVTKHDRHIINSCQQLMSIIDASDTIKVACKKNQEAILNSLYADSTYRVPDSMTVGSYKIIDSYIEIIQPWKFNFSSDCGGN